MVARRRRHQGHAEPPVTRELLESVRSVSHPLSTEFDLDPLLKRIGDARFVLLGEASHGTHEYYTWRAAITRRLIQEKGFSFIAVEGDWPDCYRVNRHIKGYDGAGESARDVLHAFDRWPTWMWANEEIVELTEWLRRYNDRQREENKVGFYGLDVYSLWDSLYQVMAYLGKNQPHLVATARRAFQCFEPYGEDVQEYARATRWVDKSCEDEVLAVLRGLQTSAPAYPHDGRESRFNAEQNALVVKNAELYYRTMVRGGPDSWNIRDRHMAETLDHLMQRHGPDACAIVWAHNTHIGDARYTDMIDDDMINLGQLVRERHDSDGVVLVGFGSYQGSVIAGAEWEAPMERIRMPRARQDSWEDVLARIHDVDQMLIFNSEVHDDLLLERGHRAIGVVYHPEYESYGNYVPTTLPHRYEAFLFFRHTQALRPLHDVQTSSEHEVPDTFPTGQ